VVIILRDDAYGMIKWKQAHMDFANYGLDYGNPDFVAYAQSYGAKGWRVGATAELLPLVKACLEEPAVHLIDVPVDYSLNDETLNVAIRQLSQAL
jgi:acetolactate synthase-1/2/3 large subunit